MSGGPGMFDYNTNYTSQYTRGPISQNQIALHKKSDRGVENKIKASISTSKGNFPHRGLKYNLPAPKHRGIDTSVPRRTQAMIRNVIRILQYRSND